MRHGRFKRRFVDFLSIEYVTSNCMGRAVPQFEKEVTFRSGTGEECVSSNCMGRTVRQFEKEVSFKLETGENM